MLQYNNSIEAVANCSEAMGAEAISKNGRSLKSQMSKASKAEIMKKFGLLFFFFVSFLFFFGCASTGFLMAKPKVTMFGNTYPPKAKNETIDFYLTDKPTREYIEFAKITVGDTNDQWCMEQIQKKAREIGADAVVIIGKVGSSGMGVPAGEFTTVVSKDYGMSAVAIKYKQ